MGKLLTREERQQMALHLFRQAAEKFIGKVESGRTQSVETYTELKECVEFLKQWGI